MKTLQSVPSSVSTGRVPLLRRPHRNHSSQQEGRSTTGWHNARNDGNISMKPPHRLIEGVFLAISTNGLLYCRPESQKRNRSGKRPMHGLADGLYAGREIIL